MRCLHSIYHIVLCTPAAALVWLAVSADSAPAAITVTNTDPSGAGSLAVAVKQANDSPGHDTIDFAIGECPCTIALSATLTIRDDLTIDAPPIEPNPSPLPPHGYIQIFISGDEAIRVLEVMPGITFTQATSRASTSAAPTSRASSRLPAVM